MMKKLHFMMSLDLDLFVSRQTDQCDRHQSSPRNFLFDANSNDGFETNIIAIVSCGGVDVSSEKL